MYAVLASACVMLGAPVELQRPRSASASAPEAANEAGPSVSPEASTQVQAEPPVLPPVPGEGDPVPEHAQAERATPPTEPEPVTEPPMAAAAEAPSSVGPSDPEPAPIFDPLEEQASSRERLDDEYVRVSSPRWRGTGMMATAGILFGVTSVWQLFDGVACGGGCGFGLGVGERLLLSGTVGFAAGGAANRARADAFEHAVARRRHRDTRRLVIAGAVTAGLGIALGVTNDAMYWRCIVSDEGPYVADGFCRQGMARTLLDTSAIATSAGAGMLTYGLRYGRDARRYERARTVAVVPRVGRYGLGLGVQGRF